jgi:hypothetical protein
MGSSGQRFHSHHAYWCKGLQVEVLGHPGGRGHWSPMRERSRIPRGSAYFKPRGISCANDGLPVPSRGLFW